MVPPPPAAVTSPTLLGTRDLCGMATAPTSQAPRTGQKMSSGRRGALHFPQPGQAQSPIRLACALLLEEEAPGGRRASRSCAESWGESPSRRCRALVLSPPQPGGPPPACDLLPRPTGFLSPGLSCHMHLRNPSSCAKES